MTPNKEDYLKVIYEQSEGGGLASNKVIAERLGVTPASVTEMLTKLSKQGLINYTAYKGSSLTEEGLKNCASVVRGHRLWEVFLMRELGYKWSDAHEDAHLLEHATPERMIDKLDEYLGYPDHCPHGSVIPRENGVERAVSLKKLSDLSAGDSAKICKVMEEKELLDYLEALGLAIGKGIEVKEIGKYEGPISCSIDGDMVDISFKAANKIYVV